MVRHSQYLPLFCQWIRAASLNLCGPTTESHEACVCTLIALVVSLAESFFFLITSWKWVLLLGATHETCLVQTSTRTGRSALNRLDARLVTSCQKGIGRYSRIRRPHRWHLINLRSLPSSSKSWPISRTRLCLHTLTVTVSNASRTHLTKEIRAVSNSPSTLHVPP
jgi:hypothetical protein